MDVRRGLCSQREIALHTHDSIAYKRCRRMWNFSSPFREHLQPKPSVAGVNPNLWFGSAIHFVMEDYHGYRRFSSVHDCFDAYIEAHTEVPENIEELRVLGHEMLDYYLEWSKKYDKWETVWIDGKPLVEVKMSLVLEELCHYLLEEEQFFSVGPKMWMSSTTGKVLSTAELEGMGAEYVEIVFHGTLDRVVKDEYGDWWILDYKTATQFDTAKLATDPQISKYCWAAEQWLEHEIEGMIYIQMSKSPPKPPRVTQRGLSTDKRQRTTRGLYKAAILKEYGELARAPKKYLDMLDYLSTKEDENGDQFIRYDLVPRNRHSKIATYKALIAEGREMIDPKLPIYPNPTRDCSWDCPFRVMCIAMDEGADWEIYLEDFEKRIETMTDDKPEWLLRLYRQHRDKYPEEYTKYCSLDKIDSLEDFIKDGEGCK